MLHNNLDPEVAERPDDLVVYGGTGKAARSWEAFDVIVRELRELADDETLLVQSGKAVGRFRTHPDAPRVLLANSNLVGRWANVGRVPPARGARPHHVRPDDRGLVDLHRLAGHRAGHASRRSSPRARRTRRAPRAAGAGCSPRGSAAWAARSRSPRRWRAWPASASRSTRRASRSGSAPATSTSASTISTAPSPPSSRASSAGAPRSIALCAQRRRRLPGARAPRRHARPRHRADRGARSARRLRPAGAHARAGGGAPRARPQGVRRAREGGRCASRSRRCSRCSARGAEVFDYGNNIRTCAMEAGARRAFDDPRLRARRTCASCSARARARSGGSRSRAIPRTSAPPTARCSRRSRGDADLRRWIELARQQHRVPGPARAHLLARLRRPREGRARASTSWSAPARSRRRS